ncbi:MAG: metal ABC transporter solute-binding protein, Zn/Mn family, partial [Lewinella sp.]
GLNALGFAQPTEDPTLPLVVTSASIFADMTEMIAGGHVRVESVVPIGGDPHIYEPTPSDVQLVSRANLVLINGLTFEGWMNELIENSGTIAETITITEGIGTIASEEYANSSDPHAWMTAANGLIYVRNIRDALIELDPFNRKVYEFNAGVYLQQLEDLDAEIFRQIASIPEKDRILITSHDAFRYYGRHYGIQVEAALGTSTDAEVQTSDVNRLTNIIRDTGVPAIFVESTINPKLIRQIAIDNDVIIGGYLYADSLGEPDTEAGTYLGMLTFNTNTIVQALKGNTADIKDGMAPKAGQQLILLGIILAVMAGAFFFMVRRINRGVA